MGFFDKVVSGAVGGANKIANNAKTSLQSGDEAYRNARNAGASTGRARYAAQQADRRWGQNAKTGLGYEANYLISSPEGRAGASTPAIQAALNELQSRGMSYGNPQAYSDFESWANEKMAKNHKEDLYKGRNKSWAHERLDEALGTEGVGGLANDLLFFSPAGVAADTFFPEWAFNPLSQEEAAKESANPLEFTGEYSMPSAEHMQSMSPEELERWQDKAGDLASRDLMLMLTMNPGAQKAAEAGKVGGPTIGDWGKAVTDMAKEGRASKKTADELAGVKGAGRSGAESRLYQDAGYDWERPHSGRSNSYGDWDLWSSGSGRRKYETEPARSMPSGGALTYEERLQAEREAKDYIAGKRRPDKRTYDRVNYNQYGMGPSSGLDWEKPRGGQSSYYGDWGGYSYLTPGGSYAGEAANQGRSRFGNLIDRIFGRPTSGLTTAAERQARLDAQDAAINSAKTGGKSAKFNPAEFRAGENLGPAGPEVVIPEATPEAAKAAAKASGKKAEEFGPAFGAQPVKPAKGKLASDAKKEISPELNYGPLQRPGIPGSRTELAVQNILGGGAEKSAAEKVLEKQAGKRQPTVEELISRGEKIPEAAAEKAPASVEDDLMNLFKGVGQEKPKAKEQLTGELDKLNKQTLELEKQISKLPEGSEEIKAARQALAEASEKKVKLAEKDPEVMKRLLSGSGEGESRIMGVEERIKANREMLRPGQEKRLGGKIGKILDRDVAAADRFTGNVGDMAGFYGDDLIARSQKLSPRAQRFLSEQLSPAMNSAQKPTKAQFEDIVKAVEKSERRAPKLDARWNNAAMGVSGALAAVGGVVNAVETANNSASPYTTCGGFGIDEAGNMVFSAAYGVTAEEVVATVEAAGTAVTESGEVIPGVSQEEWDNMSQREQYQKIVEADAYSRWLVENFGDEYVGDYGYEGWRDLASGGDKRALIAAMLGYSDDGQYLIPGWQEMWEQSGVDFSGDNDQDIENVYQYMWGDENIIDPDMWLTSGDTAYQGSHNLSEDEESAKRLAEYMLDQEGFDIENLDQQLFPAGYNNQDLAALIMYQNDVLNNADAFGSWTQEDLDKLSDLLGEAGDSRKYQFNDTSEELWELPSKNYGWNRWYDLWARGKEPAEYYDGADVDNVVDANLAAAYMKMIEDSTGKKIGRA